MPRGPITAKGFIYSISNILKENTLNKTKIKRYDYKTKALISLADKYNKSFENFKWF